MCKDNEGTHVAAAVQQTVFCASLRLVLRVQVFRQCSETDFGRIWFPAIVLQSTVRIKPLQSTIVRLLGIIHRLKVEIICDLTASVDS